jgi:uncharacterized protein
MRPRIPGLDLARALAILAMVAVSFDQVLSNQLGPAWVERLMLLPLGRASALFVVLAGIGTTFLVHSDLRRGRLVLARRASVLLVLGYVFLALAWDTDILHFYGYYFLLAIPCVGLADRWLIRLALLSVLPVTLCLLAGWDFDRGWVLDRLEYLDLWTRAGHLRHLFFNGFYALSPWMAFFLWGMWLGRRLREDPDAARLMVGRATTVAVGVEVLSLALRSAFGSSSLGPWFATVSMPPSPLYVVAAGATATALIGLSCVVADRWPKRLPVRAMIHTGQLALTIYLAHVVIGMGPFDTWYQLGCLSRLQVFAWWVVFCYGSVLIAHRWRLRWDQGPFEWLLRAIGGTST